jgi:hypothetical protein
MTLSWLFKNFFDRLVGHQKVERGSLIIFCSGALFHAKFLKISFMCAHKDVF